eukprot:gene9333-1420_t
MSSQENNDTQMKKLLSLKDIGRKRAATQTQMETPAGILVKAPSEEFLDTIETKQIMNPLNLGFRSNGTSSGNNSLNNSTNHLFSQSFKRQSVKLPNLRNHTIETQKNVYKPNITSTELKKIIKENDNTDTENMDKTVDQLEYYENKLLEEQTKYTKLIKVLKMYTEVSEKDAIEYQTTNFFYQKLNQELNEREKEVEVLSNQLKSVKEDVNILKKENEQLRNIMTHLKSQGSQNKKCNIL